jgi:hypothetical protein
LEINLNKSQSLKKEKRGKLRSHVNKNTSHRLFHRQIVIKRTGQKQEDILDTGKCISETKVKEN